MKEQLIHQSCREFSEALASKAPVPGGGGAAALIGALAAALGSMAVSSRRTTGGCCGKPIPFAGVFCR